MRPLAALALAAALAACTGDVDGAPCTVPGATVDCPGGQACGNDRRCSARALACAGTRCTPGESACVDPAGVGSGTAVARRCVAADPVCGAFSDERCDARGYVCGVRSGAPACECPQTSTRELLVLPDGAAVDALPFATGAASPPGCAFQRLTDASSRALAIAYAGGADPTMLLTITVAGVPAGSTRVFSVETGEGPQYVFPRGGVVRSDAAAGGGTYELVCDGDGEAYCVLMLPRSRLEGFTVRHGRGTARDRGLFLACPASDGPATVRISSVTIEARSAGGAAFGEGISNRTCALSLEDVHVRNAGVGLWWDATPGSSSIVSLHGGSITGSSAAGIRVAGGHLRIEGTRVAGNAGVGVDVSAGSLELRGSRIVGNGDAGVVVSSPGELRLVGNTIWGNGATTEWGGAPVTSGAARRAGGVVLAGAPPAAGLLEVARNRIYGNRGDQLLVLGPASATWSLDQPGTCRDAQGPATNMFGCYDPTPVGTASYRGIVALDAGVSALNQWWGPAGPSAADVARLPGGAIPVTTTCTWAAPALDCASEDPPP